MDYGDVLKKAWRITWRYKILWVLGFFAGAAGGANYSGGGGGSSASSSSGTSPTSLDTWFQRYYSPLMWQTARDWLIGHLAVICIALAGLVLFGLVMWVLSVAARGGLIHLANEAEEGRPVRLREGWAAGFREWWRVFGVGLLTGLPVLLFTLVVLGFLALVIVSALRNGVSAGSIRAAGASIVLTTACFLGILGVVVAIVGTMLGIVSELAQRYVVLQDERVLASIRHGWIDLWSRRGAFLMFLVTVGVGLAYGIATGVLLLMCAVPIVALLFARVWILAAVLTVVLVLLFMVPAAAYSTYRSALWTVFFRKMSGMEPVPVSTAPSSPAVPPGAPVPPPYTPSAAPPVPAQYSPPAPPQYVPPVPPVPPAPPQYVPPVPPVAPGEAPDA